MTRFGFHTAVLAFLIGVALTVVVTVVGVPVRDEDRAWAAVFLVSTYLLAIKLASKEATK